MTQDIDTSREAVEAMMGGVTPEGWRSDGIAVERLAGNGRVDMAKPTKAQVARSILNIHYRENGYKPSRECDAAIGRSLGWRVSRDNYWNWHPGPKFDPPGDEYCIRRDARNDVPCNEALPAFTRHPSLLDAELDGASVL
jgi:hypothetical protein